MELNDFCKLEQTKCVECGATFTAATNLSSNAPTPKPNNVSICTECAAVMIFNDDLTFRKPTDEDFDRIVDNPQLLINIFISRAAIIEVIKARENEKFLGDDGPNSVTRNH